jgi:acetylornithine deacetylase/succinyl-diaminopimelate desuccinylase-like protein
VSKSDFATYAYALAALKAAVAEGAAAPSGAVELHFTYDEETGGEFGPKWLLDKGISRPDFAISAGFSYGIVTAHNGCLHLEVEVVGKSGHAARPETGIDALEAASAILAEIYAYRKTLAETRSSVPGIASPTLVVGLISGGINTNVVPDNVKFRIDRRIVPDESPAVAERALRGVVEAAARRWPELRVEARRVLLAEPFVPLPGQEKLVEAIARNARAVLGADVAPHGVPLYTDARHYSAAGVPTVLYGAGPRTLEEAKGHRADENLVLADLYAATEVVALSFVDLLEASR